MCESPHTRKDGTQSGRQRYRCRSCRYRFQYAKRVTGQQKILWYQYAHRKQTLAELQVETGKSHVWVRRHLDAHQIDTVPAVAPEPTVIVPDTTFWGRGYGVTVFRSWTLKKNIWWQEVTGERQATYYYGRKILESQGWTFVAAVVDGRRGLATVFKDIPVQVCHFHQMRTVTRYLTRRPETPAGQELRAIMLSLPNTTEKVFARALASWEKKWWAFITEKTYVIGTKHWYYTHKNVNGAYHSLSRNLPYLFTYQKYPALNIPNTTNTIDGYFTSLKKKVHAHQGLRKDRRYKLICELLRSS